MALQQSPRRIIMVRPRHFGFNAETAESNSFQKKEGTDAVEQVQQKALQEFDEAVRLIREAGVDVKVFEDREDEPKCPDAVFPNNWFSTHLEEEEEGKKGLVVLYPMMSKLRRLEVRVDVVEHLKESGQVSEVLDLTAQAAEGKYLEGTGSIIFDYVFKKAYACRSPRTDETLLRQVCDKLGYESVIFTSKDKLGKAVYHTNVIMWIGTKAAGICLESIQDEEERKMVLESLKSTKRNVIPLNLDAVEAFCGNAFETVSDKGKAVFIVSASAYAHMSETRKEELKVMFDKIVVCDVGTIEKVGGGSIRCMIAGDYLGRKC